MTGLLRRVERRQRGALTILCYHRVLPEGPRCGYFAPQLVVTPEVFRHHCDALVSKYEILPLAEAVYLWSTGENLKRPLAAITFDDGYRDNYQYAAPILLERGIRATFFIITELVGSLVPPWYDRLARGWARSLKSPGGPPASAIEMILSAEISDRRGLKPPTPHQVVSRAKTLLPEIRAELLAVLERHAGPDEMNELDRIMGWPELASLGTAGHEIGSHTATHPILTQLDEEVLVRELEVSRSCLGDRLGTSIRSFCYPNGDLNDRVVQAVSTAGYDCAVTSWQGTNRPGSDLYRLARRFIDQDRLSGFDGACSAPLLHAELCGLTDLLLLRQFRARRA